MVARPPSTDRRECAGTVISRAATIVACCDIRCCPDAMHVMTAVLAPAGRHCVIVDVITATQSILNTQNMVWQATSASDCRNWWCNENAELPGTPAHLD